MAAKKDRYVVVTTAHRGVFGGIISAIEGDRVTLTKARNCLTWHECVRGVFGLAATGPNSKCRIGPTMDAVTLYGVTAIVECSADARKSWENATW